MALDMAKASGRLLHFESSLANARQRIAERDSYLNQTLSGAGRGALASKRLGTFYGGILVLQRIFECPVDLVKTIHVAKQLDGGKWLCGLNLVPQHCVVYSLGSNYDASFEQYIQKHVRKPCKVHIYDPTLRVQGDSKLAAFRETMRESLRATVHEVGLATSASGGSVQIRLFNQKDRRRWSTNKTDHEMASFPAQTLEEMFASNGHDGRCVDIVKVCRRILEHWLSVSMPHPPRSLHLPTIRIPSSMQTTPRDTNGTHRLWCHPSQVDVEGVEGALFRSTQWSRLCIRILLVEVHAEQIEKREKQAYTVGELANAIQRLERAGLMLYSSEVVCGNCNGQAELGFVNVTWLRKALTAVDQFGSASGARGVTGVVARGKE